MSVLVPRCYFSPTVATETPRKFDVISVAQGIGKRGFSLHCLTLLNRIMYFFPWLDVCGFTAVFNYWLVIMQTHPYSRNINC